MKTVRGMDDFARDTNKFTWSGKLTGVVMGIDYDYVPGENRCKIYVDGVEYVAPEVTFNYDFSQRHIFVVNDWLNGDGLKD